MQLQIKDLKVNTVGDPHLQNKCIRLPSTYTVKT